MNIPPLSIKNSQDMGVILSEKAKTRIRFLKKNDPILFLRISVLGGGCSGYQYKFELNDKKEEDDVFFFDTAQDTSSLLAAIDSISIPFLSNSLIDYSETLETAEFIVKNPNATARCGCGNSFTL